MSQGSQPSAQQVGRPGNPNPQKPVIAGNDQALRSVPQNKLEALLAGPKEIRLAVAVVLVAFILVSLVMFTTLFKSGSSTAKVTSPQTLPITAGNVPSHSVDTQVNDSKPAVGTVNQAPLMNQTPANEIDLSMIDNILGTGASSTIIFRDGSRMALDPYTLEQLPRDIQLRVTYSRGPEGQSQPPEARRRPGAPNAR
jgi:hypothetical protein